MIKPRYVMIGGFLGAGKTTAILHLTERLTRQGLKVGVIMNDQSTGLVDTATTAAHGYQVEEVAGGCFCCRFNSLVDAAERLSAAAVPDVFIAEPVGSCTDLKATVAYPLRRMYGDNYEIAPLSVVVDPLRALRIFGGESGRSFSSKVLYIYRKQLEEADLIVLNKRDLVSDPRRWEALRAAMAERFPRAEIFEVSARDGSGIDRWFARMLSTPPERTGPAELDYERYGEGEALLGWLNGLLRVSGTATDGNRFLVDLATRVQRHLASDGVEVAHLKLTLSADEGRDIAVVNLVGTDRVPELSHVLGAPIDTGELLVNLRAEADPELLRRRLTETVESYGGLPGAPRVSIEHVESFRPGQPTPTHRLAEV